MGRFGDNYLGYTVGFIHFGMVVSVMLGIQYLQKFKYIRHRNFDAETICDFPRLDTNRKISIMLKRPNLNFVHYKYGNPTHQEFEYINNGQLYKYVDIFFNANDESNIYIDIHLMPSTEFDKFIEKKKNLIRTRRDVYFSHFTKKIDGYNRRFFHKDIYIRTSRTWPYLIGYDYMSSIFEIEVFYNNIEQYANVYKKFQTQRSQNMRDSVFIMSC